MGNKLDTGDAFPTITLNMLDGSQTKLPAEPAGDYQIVLFYRGFFWPYCLRQLGGFSGYKKELANFNATVIAASAEPREKAEEMAGQVNMPIAYGVTQEQAETIGAFWEDRRQILHATNFILSGGKVLSATYSTGPVGRLEPADAVRFIQFQEKLRQQK